MRFRFRNWLLFLVIASSLRCGDGPTQPTPVALDLDGAWTLTVNDQSAAIVVQDFASSVFFEWGFFEFKGTHDQYGGLSGRLTHRTMLGLKRYDLRGTATSTRIELSGDGYSLLLTR